MQLAWPGLRVAAAGQVYRNERRLGTLWTGLAGRELCWFASVNIESAVRVKGGAPPAGWYGTGVSHTAPEKSRLV